MENIDFEVLKKGEAPTSRFPIWKNIHDGFYRCIRCKYKSKFYTDTKQHYDDKHKWP